MAELQTISADNHKKTPGVKKSKKLSTRVDLTPMVDLGFLLITFFIFTTTMSKPKSLALLLPKDSKDSLKQPESGALTLIPSGDNKLFYYEGSDPSKIKSSNIHSAREIIRNKQIHTRLADFMVIIKPTFTCNYKNTIYILDEMLINQVGKYAMVDLSPEELKRVEFAGKTQ